MTDSPTREDALKALHRIIDSDATMILIRGYGVCDPDDVLTLTKFLENTIVIDRDKVPKGLDQSIVNACDTYQYVHDELNDAVGAAVSEHANAMTFSDLYRLIKAAALLAEKVEG